MVPLSLSELSRQYAHLRARFDKQAISVQQYVEAVRQLQAQDEAGRWWAIDPQTGQYLTYSDEGWVEATPPAQRTTGRPPTGRRRAEPQQVEAEAPAQSSAIPQAAQSQLGCLSSPLATGLMSFGAAGLWFVWTSIRAVGGYEKMDLLTPLLIGGLPFLLRLFQKRLDEWLRPLYGVMEGVPRAFRVGAALGVPVIMGLMTSGGGVGAVRRATFISVIAGWILTRVRGGAT